MVTSFHILPQSSPRNLSPIDKIEEGIQTRQNKEIMQVEFRLGGILRGQWLSPHTTPKAANNATPVIVILEQPHRREQSINFS